jgi:MFS family permease
MDKNFVKDRQYYQFCAYGFLKNLRFFDPFFLLYLHEIGLNYLQIGILYSIRQITVNILEIPSGIIADAFGRKKSMILSMSAYLVSFVLFFLVSKMSLLSLAMIFFGIGEAFRSGTHKAMILEYLRLNNQLHLKTQYYGSTRSCSQLGSALSAFLAMIIVFYSGDLHFIFVVSTIPYIANLIQLATYPNALDGRNEEIHFKDIINHTKKALRLFVTEFKNPKILHGLFSASIFTALYKTTKDYLQPMIKSLALSLPVFVAMEQDKRTAIFIGVIYTLLYLITSYASKNSYLLERRFNRLDKAINVTYLSGVIILGISGLFLKFNIIIMAVILFVGIYVVQNFRRPMVVSYLSEIIPGKVMASGLSTESQLQTIIIIIYAPFFGFIADLAGLYAAFILTGALFLLLYPFIRISHNPN